MKPKRKLSTKALISTKTGIRVRSRLEKTVADDLTERGVKYLYEKDKVGYTVPTSYHVYTPDFKLRCRKWVVEAKGVLDADTRKKMLHVKASNPDLDIRFVFQRDNVLRKGSKTKYSDWATQHGFKWAIGKVPEDWINEDF